MVPGLPLGGTTRVRTCVGCSSLPVSGARPALASGTAGCTMGATPLAAIAFVIFMGLLVFLPSNAGTRDWCAPRCRWTREPRSRWVKCPRSVSEQVEQVDGPPAGDESDRDSRNERDCKRIEHGHHGSSKWVLVGTDFSLPGDTARSLPARASSTDAAYDNRGR